MNERELSLFAYRTHREVRRVLASTPPSEAPDRVEDTIYDAFLVVDNDARRTTRREFTE
jgi:hypothetical protein